MVRGTISSDERPERKRRAGGACSLTAVYGLADIVFSPWRRAGGGMAHILLAEDDESLRKFLASALIKAGHAVTDFGDGAEAWECIKGFTFDLLLTDIVMPGL